MLIPWENVLFYRHTRAAIFIRATLHRYSAFAFVQRTLKVADMMIGAALFNVRQTGLDKQQAVQEKLAELAVWREGINAHLTAAIAMAEKKPRRIADAEPVAADDRPRACLHQPAADDAHRARTLRRPDLRDARRRHLPRGRDSGEWLEKFYTINDEWVADDRRKLLAFARDLLNSDYAGHRLTFQLFAQSPPFAHLAAVYRNFDWNNSLDFVQNAAGLSDKVMGKMTRTTGDSAVSRWFATQMSKAAE